MSSTLTITTIQTDLHWEDKIANLEMLEKKIMRIGEKTEIVLLPEMFNTGFSMNPRKFAEPMDGDTVTWMKNIAAKKKIVLTGSLMIEDGGKYYNRLVWMLPNGQYGFYDKRHRFAYAGEDKEYTSGQRRLIASVKGWRINLLVCYDLRFPVWARQRITDGAPEYDLLIYVANWPSKRSHAWKTLLQARAIENQVFTIGVNRVGTDGNEIQYVGETTIVDPLGEVLYQQKDIEDVHTITLHKEQLENVRAQFPFWKDADGFEIVEKE